MYLLNFKYQVAEAYYTISLILTINGNLLFLVIVSIPARWNIVQIVKLFCVSLLKGSVNNFASILIFVITGDTANIYYWIIYKISSYILIISISICYV